MGEVGTLSLAGQSKIGNWNLWIPYLIYCILILLNYRLSQKLKLLGNGEFNYLIVILILPPRVALNSPLISRTQQMGFLTF